MKFITATIAAFAIASAASAGNPVFEAPVEVEVMEEEEMVEPVGSSAGGWIVPVLAVLAIAAAVAASDDD
ncbi:MAG: hypothetical protein AAF679_06940 [Pseudomonadota bacterium]